MSPLAWLTKLNVGNVGFVGHERLELAARSYPIVLFTPLPHGGWTVLPWHTRRGQVARCAGLNAGWIYTPASPRRRAGPRSERVVAQSTVDRQPLEPPASASSAPRGRRQP